MTAGAPAIEVRGLRKAYGSLEAVRGVDFEVARGEVFALLGPNGAGKTTTVEILEGYRDRDGGDVRVLGHDPARHETALRERIGVVLQTSAADPYLTVEEAVSMFRGYYPRPRPLEETLQVVGLVEQRRQRVRQLSGGQQRRLDVAIGLAGDPDLIFLDEPTTGFDPSARRDAWGLVRNLRELGKTVLLTTHYMDEAQQLADRVAIIARGVMIAEGTPASLMARGDETTITFRLADAGALPEGLPGAMAVHDSTVTLTTAEPTRALHALTSWALATEVELEGLLVSRPSLEDVYLELTAEAEVSRPPERSEA